MPRRIPGRFSAKNSLLQVAAGDFAEGDQLGGKVVYGEYALDAHGGRPFDTIRTSGPGSSSTKEAILSSGR